MGDVPRCRGEVLFSKSFMIQYMKDVDSLLHQLPVYSKLNSLYAGGDRQSYSSPGIDYYRLPQDVPQGALILSIGSRDAAIYKAGAEIYDIITEFNGNAITSIQDLQSVLAECKAGDTAEMTIYRISRDGTGGTEIKLSFILDAAE